MGHNRSVYEDRFVYVDRCVYVDRSVYVEPFQRSSSKQLHELVQ